MLLIEESINQNSSLISLLSTNKGDYDICALIYDICTENYEMYLDKDILERLTEVKEASQRAYVDLKAIINLINKKYVIKDNDKKLNSKECLIIFDNNQCTYISNKFDSIFIYNFIKAFYSKEISKFEI